MKQLEDVSQSYKNKTFSYWLFCPRNPYWRERLGTFELLLQTIWYQLLFKLEIFFTYYTKQATLTKRSTVLSLPLQFVLPDSAPPCRVSLPLVSLYGLSWHHLKFQLLPFIVGYTNNDLVYRWTEGRGVNIASDMKLSQFDLISTPMGNATTFLNKGNFSCQINLCFTHFCQSMLLTLKAQPGCLSLPIV